MAQISLSFPLPVISKRSVISAVNLIFLIMWTIVLVLLERSTISILYNRELYIAFWGITIPIVIIKPVWLRVKKNKFFMLLLIVTFLFYLFVQGLLLSGDLVRSFIFNATLTSMITAVCIGLVFQNTKNEKAIIKIYILIHFTLGLSAICSTLFLILSNFDPSPWTISYISEPVYRGEHFILLPFSEYWSTVQLVGPRIPRFVGLYREPGVAQVYFLTAYFLTFFVQIRFRKAIQTVLLIASILLFSTAGIINLLIGTLVLYLLNPEIRPKIAKMPVRTIGVFVAAGVAATIFLTMSSELNVFVKWNQHVSGEFRQNSLAGGLEQFLEKPIMGHGYYHNYSENEAGQTTSFKQTGLISSAYEIGVLGVVFYFGLWGYSIKKLGSWRTLCIYVPTLITLLTFQSTYLTAFIFFLMLMDTKSYQLISKRNYKNILLK